MTLERASFVPRDEECDCGKRRSRRDHCREETRAQRISVEKIGTSVVLNIVGERLYRQRLRLENQSPNAAASNPCDRRTLGSRAE